MKKAEEKKLIKNIKDSLGENFNESDMLLITELIDWLKIASKAKADLSVSVKDGGSMDWQALTTISMSSKAIITTLKALGITPTDRLKQKLLNKTSTDSAITNLNKFLNG